MDAAFSIETGAHRTAWRAAAGLCIVALIGLVFVSIAALPYFRLTEVQFGMYWPRRWWLLAHITGGIVALLAGPVQLWLGLTRPHTNIHRRLGMTYIGSVSVSSLAGYYLAFHTELGWVFGAGLAGLATAWIATTGLAFLAIRRRFYDQHKEWMIRSYVVTTAFVSFRLVLKCSGKSGLERRANGSQRWPGSAGRCRSSSPRLSCRVGKYCVGQ